MERRTQAVWILTAVALLLAVGSATTEGGVRRLFRLGDDIRAVEARNRALAETTARLRRDIEALRGDPRAVERAAREELGYVRAGELVFSLESP
jgi:cell division protein FtsB